MTTDAFADALAEAQEADAKVDDAFTDEVEDGDIPADFAAALALEEARIPMDAREALRKEELGEVVGDITDDSGNKMASAMRRVKDSPEWESFVNIYSTLDGMPSRVLRGMAAKKLRQRWPEGVSNVPQELWGRPVFTRKPLKKYRVGEVKCLLNPEHPRHEFVVLAGLGHLVCMKSNMPTEFAARQHMQHKHSDEWQALEDARIAAETAEAKAKTEESNAMLRALLETLAADRAPVKETTRVAKS